MEKYSWKTERYREHGARRANRVPLPVLLVFGVTLLLYGCPAAEAYAAYMGSGSASENRFTLAAVCSFTARLVPELSDGSGGSAELCWYELSDGAWVQSGPKKTVTEATAEESGALEVPLSFRQNERAFRYELRNEAGIVLSERFFLRVTEDGSGLLCERKPYTANLSEQR